MHKLQGDGLRGLQSKPRNDKTYIVTLSEAKSLY